MKEISTPEVLVYQRSQLSAQELCDLEAVKKRALSWQSEISMGSERDALAAARDHLFERHSVVPGHAILAESLNQASGLSDVGWRSPQPAVSVFRPRPA